MSAKNSNRPSRGSGVPAGRSARLIWPMKMRSVPSAVCGHSKESSSSTIMSGSPHQKEEQTGRLLLMPAWGLMLSAIRKMFKFMQIYVKKIEKGDGEVKNLGLLRIFN